MIPSSLTLTPEEGALLMGFRAMPAEERACLIQFAHLRAGRERERIETARAEQKGKLRLVAVNGKRRK